MRTWVYSWKSSDGLRHEGELSAPDKDAVYDALRKRGIRAIRVTERIQPVVRKGFAGLRKRDWGLIGLCLVTAVAGVVFLAPRFSGSAGLAEKKSALLPVTNKALPLPRHQLSGKVKVGDLALRPSEAYLVRYIQPGDLEGFFRTGEPEVATPEILEDLIANVKTPIVIGPGDDPSAVEVKRAVAGVKAEVALLLSGGRGLTEILTWLDERQKMEASHRKRIEADYRRGATDKAASNRILRSMGLKEIE